MTSKSRKIGVHLIVQLVVALVVGAIGLGVALVLAGAGGGVAMGVAPDATFGLVEGFVCHPGERLEYESVRRSYHRPGESQPNAECVAPTGTRRNVTGQALAYFFGLTFLVCFLASFLVLYVPLGLVALFVTRSALRKRTPSISTHSGT